MPRKKRLAPVPIDTTDQEIGQRIAARRIELGLTQTQLAKSLGLIQSLISAYERGALRLTADMICRFSKILGVSADYLLNLEPTNQKNVFSLKFTSRMAAMQNLPKTTLRHLFQLIDLYIKGEKLEKEIEPEGAANEIITFQPVQEGNKWTAQDEEILRLYFPHLPKKQILELLPKQNWTACVEMADKLKIKRFVEDDFIPRLRAKPGKRTGPRGPLYSWTAEDRQVIQRMYPYEAKKEILRKLKHRTWHAIQKEASRLHIKREVSDFA